MDPRALARAIDADVAAGARPVAVVATAGTVNVGAIDPIDHVAGVCAERGVWLHVDAAFGAAALLSPSLRPRLAGVERCDSASFDFHKWFHAPYATGCALVRRADEHLASFSTSPHYLASFGEGVSAGRPWACDLGPDLSRPFNALPVWFTLQHHGADRLAEVVERNVRLATRLAEMVDDHPRLERLAPTPLNIVCFRYVPDAPASPGALDDLNAAIITRLQISGVAAPSSTRIDGALAIRVNLTNHRTTEDDLRILVEAIERLGGELAPAIAP
jgi:aromatic-L-amino-acid decarboxylase